MSFTAAPHLGLPTDYLVDDEDVVRDALAWLLRSRRLLSEGYPSAEAFEAMLDVLQDVRYAGRLIRRSPAYSLTVVCVLAIGIAPHAVARAQPVLGGRGVGHRHHQHDHQAHSRIHVSPPSFG